MRQGLDWYRRKPAKFLGGVQGLTARQIAVYNIVTDLLYLYGGAIHDDPKWFAGWISDMGSAAVRTTIRELVTLGKLYREDGQLRNKAVDAELKSIEKPAENTAETEGEPGENRRKTGKKRGKNSTDLTLEVSEAKDLGPLHAREDRETEEDKSSEDRSSDETRMQPRFAKQVFEIAVEFLSDHDVSYRDARALIGKWRRSHADAAIIAAIAECSEAGAVDPVAWMTAKLAPEKPGVPAILPEDHRIEALLRKASWAKTGSCPASLISNSDATEMLQRGMITVSELRAVGVYP